MNIKQAVAKAYEELPKGSKKRASEIHGVSDSYFKRIVGGDPKDLSVYHSALNAIKQAAKEYKELVNIKVDALEEIKVDEQ